MHTSPLLASYGAVSGSAFRDILIIEGWNIVGGRSAGASGKGVMLEKLGFPTPVSFSLPGVISEKHIKQLCRYAQISPEKFDALRVRVEGRPVRTNHHA